MVGEMKLKQAAVIILLLALLAGAIFATKSSSGSERVECVVQSDQVVLNQYSKSVLRLSQSFAGNTVTSWRKGDLKPHVRVYPSLTIADHGPPNQFNEQFISINGEGSAPIFYGLLPVSCGEDLQSILK